MPEDKILSFVCGPAIIESGLIEHGCSVIGLNVSQEAIACAPDTLRTLVADAENMPFDPVRFDVVLFLSLCSLSGIIGKLFRETARELKPGDRVIAMVLNPISDFFKAKQAEADFYVRHIKHSNKTELEAASAEWFEVQGEYFLGISGDRIPSHDPMTAALYIIQGHKKW